MFILPSFRAAHQPLAACAGQLHQLPRRPAKAQIRQLPRQQAHPPSQGLARWQLPVRFRGTHTTLLPCHTHTPRTQTDPPLLSPLPLRRTVMIAHISPASLHFEESYNTLNYANRAKNIKTKVVRNVHNVQAHISEYEKIIENLRSQILGLKEQLRSPARPSTAGDGSVRASGGAATLKQRGLDLILPAFLSFILSLSGRRQWSRPQSVYGPARAHPDQLRCTDANPARAPPNPRARTCI